jgi:Glycosyl hydrolase family 12
MQRPRGLSAPARSGGIVAASVLLIGVGFAAGRLTAVSGHGQPAGLAAARGHTPTPTRPATPSQVLSSPAVAAAPTSRASTTSCPDPQFVTSAPTGGWSDGNYYLYNNMWNAAGYSVHQTMYACSYNNWYVVATMNNDSGDGAVKTYPDVQANFNGPAISSFNSISSTFAQASPDVGIYEDAYDVWINGVANSSSTEIMIWTQNHGQTPGGSVVTSASLGGRGYQVWRNGSGGGQAVTFVADSNFSSGTVNLLAFFDWVMAQGWLPANSTLDQICYGAELVSTDSAPATFSFTNFSVTTS